MHIEPTTHEHGVTGKVYRFEADYSVCDDRVDWTGEVRQGDGFYRSVSGSIPLTFAAGPALADKLVHDAIVKEIDSYAV